MITDEQIEDIIFKYTSRQDEFNMSVINVIADRLAHIADFDALNTMDSVTVRIKDIKKLKELHAEYRKSQSKHLKDTLWWIAVVVYLESLKFYEVKTELEMNKALMRAIEDITIDAQKSLDKVLSHPAIVMRDLKSPVVLKAYNLEQAYNSILQEAVSYSNVSKELRDIALKRTETQLFDSGVRYMTNVSSDSVKDTVSANNTIRMSVLDSIKNLINKMQEIMGKQFGADAVELSAHIYPAPDHAPAQGHQFSLKEVEKMQSGMDFEDLQGHSYIGFERNIGEWNCRHYFMRIKKGTSPTYTQEQLNKILEDNERGYTDEQGKHRTLYECTQVQRRYEREIRKAKEKYLYGKTLNDQIMMSRARNRVGVLTTQYKQFSKKCDIPAKLERIRVKYYK